MSYLAIANDHRILKKGDVLRNHRNEEWTFQSVTHPRKVFVTSKDDPNGPDSWPNLASREFYAGVFHLGIWDISRKEWSWQPHWDNSDLTDILRDGKISHV